MVQPHGSDLTVADAQVRDYDVSALSVAPGALDNLDNEQSYELCAKHSIEKIVGAFAFHRASIAPKQVYWPMLQQPARDEDSKLAAILDEYDTNYVKAPVVVDQNIVTAVGPMAAQNFGKRDSAPCSKKAEVG